LCRCGMELGRLLRFQRAKYWYQKSAEQGSSESKARTRIIPDTRARAHAHAYTPRTHTDSHTHAHAYTRRHARARTLPPPSLRILLHRLPPAFVRTCTVTGLCPQGLRTLVGMRGHICAGTAHTETETVQQVRPHLRMFCVGGRYGNLRILYVTHHIFIMYSAWASVGGRCGNLRILYVIDTIHLLCILRGRKIRKLPETR
jgi:hypothetical protein